MASLRRVFLERLLRLIRWFFPQTSQRDHQLASLEPVVFYSASFQPPSELTEHLLEKSLDAGIEMTTRRDDEKVPYVLIENGSPFDELPFPLDEDNFSLASIASNPSSFEPTCHMVVRGVRVTYS